MVQDYNAHIPVDGGRLAQEAQALADHAENTLRSILLQGSTRAVKPLLAFLKLKHKVSYGQLARITQLLYAIFEVSKGDAGAETRVASTLAQALQVLNKLEDCPVVGSQERLVVGWRPIYDAIIRVSLHGATWAEFSIRGGDNVMGTEVSKSHLKAMVALARRARTFFTASAAGEIMNELRPLLCHHEMSFYKAAGLLCIFLPDHGLHSAGGAGPLILELAGVWQTVPNCAEWHMLWVTMFSRMARHNIVDVLQPLQSFLPALMATFVKLLEVPTGKTKPQRSDQLGWPGDCDFLFACTHHRGKDACIKKYTRLIVFSIAPNSQTMSYVREVLTYLKPFFHPLQEGGHTKQVDMFLKMVTLNYTKRLGMESGKHRCKRPWHSAYALTEQDTADFTAIMFPLAMTAYYSKDFSMSFSAGQALKDLASISTESVLPKLLEVILNSMQNVMKPHEVQNSISITSVLVSNLLTAETGMDLIGQLMQLSVNGIDTNDPMKTMVTLRFYLSLLADMPLTAPEDLPAGATKPGILYGLQDWCAAVLDKAFALIGNISDLKKGNYLKGQVQGLLRRFFTVFFQQLSPTLYTFCLERVSRKCLATFYPPGKQFMGYLVDAAVYANPRVGVSQLVPALCTKIVNASGAMQGSDAEAGYFVTLLGHAVSRAGADLTPYHAQIDAVLAATALHSESSVAKEGQKLMRKVLRSALGVRPAECRSWSGAAVPDFSAVSGTRAVPSKAQITFRMPTDACQQRSRALIETFFAKAEAVLRNSSASQAETRSAYGCLTALVRGGAQLFLPNDFKQDAEMKDAGDDDDGEDIEPSLESPFVLQDAAWGAATRNRFGELLVTVCRAQAIPENPDVQGVKALMKLVGFFLSSKGVWTKYEQTKSSVSYSKSVHRNWEKGPDCCYPRELLVGRVSALLGKRLDSGVFEEDAVAKELLDKVGSMCMHEYSVVRKKAQTILPKVLKRFPLASTRLYSAMLQRLCDATASKGAITGVVYSLQKSEALVRIAKHWKLTHDLLTGMLASQHFDEIKVQVRLAELWNSFVPYTFPMLYGGLLHPKSLLQLPVMSRFPPDVVQADFATGDKMLADRALRDKQSQAAVIKMMQQAMTDGMKQTGASIHWRFLVLAAAALALQVRRDCPADATTAELFLRGLNSDILALRQLCRAVVPVLFLTEQASTGNAMDTEMSGEVDTDKMSEDAEVLWPENFDAPFSAPYSGKFMDATWIGWNRTVDDSAQSCGSVPAFSQAVKAVLTPDWIASTIEKTSQDHRLSGDERADSKAGGATMPLASAMLQAACDGRWAWPRTSAASITADFSKNTMLTVEWIVAASGLAGVDIMWTQLEKAAAKTDDRELQCTAAEMVGGIVRASHSLVPADQDMLRSRLAPLLTTTLAALPPDAVAAWSEMLRYVASNRDPRRLNWLTEIVLALSDSISDDTGGGALTLVKALKFQQALLMEYTWRGLPMTRAVCQKSRELLGRSSKAVREEAGRALVLVLRCLARLGRNGSAPCLEAPVFVSDWFPAHLCELYTTYTTALPAEGTPERLALKYQIEGVLYVFCHSLLLGQMTSIAPLINDGCPLMLAVQEDADREFAQIGKVALELVATSVDRRESALQVIQIAKSILGSSSSWRVRQACVNFVREISHTMVLDEMKSQAADCLDEAMGDSVLEVRSTACLSLAGLLRSLPSERISEFLARAPKPRRRPAKAKEQSEEDKTAQLVRRHAKVLAVSAAVLSSPTEVPEWMPDAVCSLCVLNDEEAIIRTTITSTVGDFRKSHQDSWDEIRMTWSEEQLRLVSESSGTQSYFS